MQAWSISSLAMSADSCGSGLVHRDLQDAGVLGVGDGDHPAEGGRAHGLAFPVGQLQIFDHVLQQRAAQDQFLVVRSQLRADLQVGQVDHRVVGRRHDVNAGSRLVQRGHQQFGVSQRQARAQDQAQDDLPGVAPQQVEQLHQVDLILGARALDDLSGRRFIEGFLFHILILSYCSISW